MAVPEGGNVLDPAKRARASASITNWREVGDCGAASSARHSLSISRTASRCALSAVSLDVLTNPAVAFSWLRSPPSLSAPCRPSSPTTGSRPPSLSATRSSRAAPRMAVAPWAKQRKSGGQKLWTEAILASQSSGRVAPSLDSAPALDIDDAHARSKATEGPSLFIPTSPTLSEVLTVFKWRAVLSSARLAIEARVRGLSTTVDKGAPSVASSPNSTREEQPLLLVLRNSDEIKCGALRAARRSLAQMTEPVAEMTAMESRAAATRAAFWLSGSAITSRGGGVNVRGKRAERQRSAPATGKVAGLSGLALLREARLAVVDDCGPKRHSGAARRRTIAAAHASRAAASASRSPPTTTARSAP
eukprot:scaffold295555_cov28-Tisochrysis_lutea.AAC.11